VLPAVTDLFCRAGTQQLDTLELGDAYADRVRSLRTLIDAYDREVARLEAQIRSRGHGDRGYRAIPAINGIGPTMAAILVAEIGDVTRFRSAPALCSWAGLTPKHQASDTTVGRGSVTKPGSRLVRWRSSRAPSATTAAGNSPPTTGPSPSGEEQSDHGHRPHSAHARLTACATARSDASPTPQEQLGHDQTRAPHRHDPHNPRRDRRTA
jgi:hypothetical protein